MNSKEQKRAASDYAIGTVPAVHHKEIFHLVENAWRAGYRASQPDEKPDEVIQTDYSHHRTANMTITGAAQTIRRMLQHLKMASLEMESFIADDRIRPEVRKAFQRYKERNIDWTLRQIRTDMKKLPSFNLVQQDLEGDKARDLQELIDFVLQFNNIAEIHAELKHAFSTQEAQTS